MSLLTLLLIVVVLAMLFSAPAWPHSRGWGYGPSGGLAALVVVLLLMMMFF